MGIIALVHDVLRYKWNLRTKPAQVTKKDPNKPNPHLPEFHANDGPDLPPCGSRQLDWKHGLLKLFCSILWTNTDMIIYRFVIRIILCMFSQTTQLIYQPSIPPGNLYDVCGSDPLLLLICHIVDDGGGCEPLHCLHPGLHGGTDSLLQEVCSLRLRLVKYLKNTKCFLPIIKLKSSNLS